MKISGTTIVAMIGAAAWVPQIISWIYHWWVKPKLSFVPENISEIGFTHLGMIINQSFAIATSKKDALIEKIILSLKHESGAKHEFIWDYLAEKGAELTTTTGQRAEFSKNQKAIALKISTLGLVEKKIFFRDISFQQQSQAFLSKVVDKKSYLDKTKAGQSEEETVKSKEFLDFSDFIKKGYEWKEGKYIVDLYVYEHSLKNPHNESYEFSLNKNHIESLEKNIKITQDFLKDTILFLKKPKEMPQYIWHWVNPAFSRRS